ncbi:Jerky protein [Phytophthora megakarya]|uniref:Jerky protein n=1 Tax=Phytophthora megakarya TaxID=4795 RepID=A0A225WG37_9STRA|nr:Jerky protein [Phytophthora megakarya]
MERKRGRGAGPRLNDLQRLDIIHKHKTASPPVSLRQLARDFGVDEKSIRRVINAASDIEKRASSSAVLNMRAHVHRRPTPRFPELEKTLALWIDARERAKAEISPSVVIDKAKLIARSMGISSDEFKASWGWYSKFSKRYGLRTAFIGSEAQNETETVKTLQELHQLMAQYDPAWIFTVEETSLFYESLPFDAEIVGKRRQVTLVLSCNSTGKLKLPVCMVGKERLSGQVALLPYFRQERAWLDRSTFGSWYSSVFVPFVRERTSKPVLLVVDGERPGHQGNFEDDGIRLVFLPPLLTGDVNINAKIGWSRPLDMGVIAALKARYKYLLVKSVLTYHNAPAEVKVALNSAENDHDGGVHFGHAPTLLDAARLLELAWNQVPDDLLENCFERGNLVPPSKLLTSPILTRKNVLEEQIQTSTRYSNEFVDKIEKMVTSSSLPASVWGLSEQLAPTNLKDRIRIFMHLDDENSPALQRQLQGEIHEVLGDVTPSMSTVESTISVPRPDASNRYTDEGDTNNSNLGAHVRALLLGITNISSQLRQLPRTGADAAKLAASELEGCITAADRIRHCIQLFDSTFHEESTEDEPSTKEAVENPT